MRDQIGPERRMGFPLQVSDNEAEMDWNKDHIRETMLSLETAALKSAREKYLDYVSTARLDLSLIHISEPTRPY